MPVDGVNLRGFLRKAPPPLPPPPPLTDFLTRLESDGVVNVVSPVVRSLTG